jgi:hypothetical protein
VELAIAEDDEGAQILCWKLSWTLAISIFGGELPSHQITKLTIAEDTVACQVPLTDIHPLSSVVMLYVMCARSKSTCSSTLMILKSNLQVGKSSSAVTSGIVNFHIALAW